MVPLRKIAEALGYQVGWDSETGAITVEDTYVQKATLLNGTEKVVFEGKLQIIDMSREIDNSVKTIIHNGYTYVPVEFFKEFLNDTTIEGTIITVAPSMCELNANNLGQQDRYPLVKEPFATGETGWDQAGELEGTQPTSNGIKCPVTPCGQYSDQGRGRAGDRPGFRYQVCGDLCR